MGPLPAALSAPPLAAEHRCQASRIVSTKAPKTEPFLPSLFLCVSMSVCCVFLVRERERGCCACEGFWVLLCFALYLRVVFFLWGVLLWRIRTGF